MHIKTIMGIAILANVFAITQSIFAMEDQKGMFPEKKYHSCLRVPVFEPASMKQKCGFLNQKYIVENDLEIARELYNQGKLSAALQYVSNSCVVVKFSFGMFLFTKENFVQAQSLFQHVADTQLSEEEVKDALTLNSVAWAQFNLAHMLEIKEDKDGSLNKNEALKYYRLAASNGLLKAHSKAAFLLCETESYEEAREYLVIPTQSGDKAACELLHFVNSKLNMPQPHG